MTDATLLADGGRPAVRLERFLADPPAVVWSALTDRSELRTWFPCDVIVEGDEWTPGASITFVFGRDANGTTLAGEVLEVDEPRLLAFTWGDDSLRFELTDSSGGTHLVLTDELPPDAAARNAAGWDVCLDRLTGHDTTAGWQSHYDAYAAEFEPVIGLQTAHPPDGRPSATNLRADAAAFGAGTANSAEWGADSFAK